MSSSDPTFASFTDPATAGDRLDLESLGFSVARPPLRPLASAHTAQRAWTGLMGTLGRNVPAHLAWSLRYRNAMAKLTRNAGRMR